MRWPIVFLIALLVALQYPLWLGRGGWLRVWEIDKDLQAQRAKTLALEQRNASLDAEVRDLRVGTEALEERARYELGFVRPGEIFVQVPNRAVARPVAPAPVGQPEQPPR
jgi:cell division protein FtsB